MTFWARIRALVSVIACLSSPIVEAADSTDLSPNLIRGERPDLLAQVQVEDALGTGKQDKEPNGVVSFQLSGRIQQADGSDACQARLVAVRLGSAHLPDSRLSASADDAGQFTVTLNGVPGSDATWSLLALHGDASGREYARFSIHTPDPSGTTVVEHPSNPVVIQLKPGRKISGTVISEVTRKPIPLAKIYNHQGQLVRTNRDGHFELRGISKEVESLAVTAQGMAQAIVAVDVTEREQANIEIFLQPGGTAQGTILDEHGNPVPGATISRTSGSQVMSAATAVRTDSNGRFVMEGVQLKRLMFPLRVEAPGYDTTDTGLFAIRDVDHPTELLVRMTRAEENRGPAGLRNVLGGGDDKPAVGAIKGNVVDPTGRPIKSFIVNLLPVTTNVPRDSGSFSASVRHFTDGEGKFVIGGLDADKRYRVAVLAPGFGRNVIEQIYARPGAVLMESDEVEFRLTLPHRLEVRVIDGETRESIPDVLVGLLENRQRREPFEWNYSLNGARTEWTTTEGNVTFAELTTEEAPVFIEHPGYARFHTYWNKSLDNPNSDNERIQIELTKESRLQLRIANLGARDPGSIYARVMTSTDCEVFSPMAKRDKTVQIDLRQLPPGIQQVSLFDAKSAEPWTELMKFPVELKTGDNDFEVDLPVPHK